jgi:hypothetical protein
MRRIDEGKERLSKQDQRVLDSSKAVLSDAVFGFLKIGHLLVV